MFTRRMRRVWFGRVLQSRFWGSWRSRRRRPEITSRQIARAGEKFEDRTLLAATWLAGLASDGDFALQLDGNTGSDFSVSQTGQVVIGPDGANNFVLDASGNVTITGALATGSSVTLKENFASIDVDDYLTRISGLPVYEWNYLTDAESVTHMSPIAEDFFAFFGLGADEQRLAPSDLSGTALVGIQGLSDVLQQHSEQINVLLSSFGETSSLDAITVGSPLDGFTFVGPIPPPDLVSRAENFGASTFVAEAATAGVSIASNGDSQTSVVTSVSSVSPGERVLFGSQFPPSGTRVLAPDSVTAQDVVVVGRAGFGADAFTGQNFGDDTLRLSEESIRVYFQDTSNSSSFPTNDWRIVVNDAGAYGDDHFSIADVDGGRVPIRFEAGAPADSLAVDATGNVGVGTPDAAANLHVVAGDTPTIRLEQGDSDANPTSTWDFGGNESSFFVRDLGAAGTDARLPFEVSFGAPANSLFVAQSGNVGIGTAIADTAVDIVGSDGTTRLVVTEESSTVADRKLLDLRNNGETFISLTNSADSSTWRTGIGGSNAYVLDLAGNANPEFQLGTDGSLVMGASPTAFVLDAAGNLDLSGMLTQPSSALLKEHFVSADAADTLSRINALPLYLWNYIADNEDAQHVGPLAEDFYAAFGLGADERHISPSDIAGVAVSGVQALSDVITSQNAQLAWLSSMVGVENVSGVASHVIAPISAGGNSGQRVLAASHIDDVTPPSSASFNVTQTQTTGTTVGTASTEVASTEAESTSPRVLAATTITDDLVVQGSLVVGESALNDTEFGFDSLRLQDDAINWHFDDTSVGSRFTSGDWRIVVNDTNVGGVAHLSVVDAETGNTVFRVEADASEFALVVDAAGEVGLGTSAPQQDLHVTSGNTPTLRLEQDTSGSFATSVWDIAANESGFFIKDETGGTVPVRIKTGAPDNSLHVAVNGDVGFGTSSPAASVNVVRSDGSAAISVEERSATTQQRDLLSLTNNGAAQLSFTNTAGASDVSWTTGLTADDGFTFDLDSTGGFEFVLTDDGQLTVGPNGAASLHLDATGNLTINGTLTQGSSRTLKENFATVDVFDTLADLIDLPIFRWNYLSDTDATHFGPTAEAFYDRFELGADAQHIAPSDLASVAFVGLQALLDLATAQGEQLELLTSQLGLGDWHSTATYSDDVAQLPGVTDITIDWTGRDVDAEAVGDASASTEHGVVSFGESVQVIHDLTIFPTTEEEPHGFDENLFLADTGEADYFKWQDQNPATPDVTDVFYDYRDEGLFANQISDSQLVAAESALAAWESAGDGRLNFVRNAAADRADIINIGVGDLAAFGFTSANEGNLAVGGGTVNHGDAFTITEGVVWLDIAENWDTETGNGNPAGTVDVFTVLSHEIGHAIGLGHTDSLSTQDVMDGAYRGEQTAFSHNDRTLVQVLYGDASLDDITATGNTGTANGSNNSPDGGEVLESAQVFSGDLIVNGRVSVGIDSNNNEAFASDTLKLRENNLRIAFDDTSTDGSPATDWQLTANSSSNGGDNYFAIDEVTSLGAREGASLFRVNAGARDDALVVDKSGRLGLGTQRPGESVHIVDGTSPTIRLGQDTSDGLTAQAWDISASDTLFNITDVTASTSSFGISAGAPTGSLFVASDGDIGFGTTSPSGRFHVQRNDGTAQVRVDEKSGSTAARDLVSLTNSGATIIRFSNIAPTTPPAASDVTVGVAHSASSTGNLVTLDYHLEHFGTTDATNLTLPHNLDDVFGVGNYVISQAPVLVSGPGSISVNADFNGTDNISLIDDGTLEGEDGRTGNAANGSTLSPGEAAHVRVVVNLHTLSDQGSGLGIFSSQVTLTGHGPAGEISTDLSDSGTDPDPNGNSDPTDVGEGDATDFTVAENPVIGVAHNIEVLGDSSATVDVDGAHSNRSGRRLTLRYTLENLGNVELSSVNLTEDLTSVFGMGNFGTSTNTTFPEVIVDGGGSLTRNTNFNGSTDTTIISSGTLSPGAIAQITVEALLITVTDLGAGLGVYQSQVTGTAQGPSGGPTSDLSDAGSETDPDGNGDPTGAGEDEPVVIAANAFIGAAQTATVSGNQVTFDVYVESFGGLALQNVGLHQELNAVFGAGNFSITTSPMLIDDPGTLVLNSAYNGTTDTELFTRSSSTLAANDTAHVQFVVSVNQAITPTATGSLGTYTSQSFVRAETSSGMKLLDMSDSGTDPDPTGNDDPTTAGENDATTFVLLPEAIIGAALDATVAGTQVTFDLYLENFGSGAAATVTATQSLDAVFGAGNYTIVSAPTLIDDPGTLVLNGAYDGSSDTNLLASGSTFPASDTAQLQFVVNVTQSVDQGFGVNQFRAQTTVSATDANGVRVVDLSDDNTNPDSSGDDDPTAPVSSENDATEIVLGNAVLGAALLGSVSGTLVTLDFRIENLGTAPASNILVELPLNPVFGSGNYSIASQPSLVSGPSDLTLSPQFFGFSVFDHVVLGGTLQPGAAVTIRVQVNVTNVSDQGHGFGVYQAQYTVNGTEFDGSAISDVSDSGSVVDSTGNGLADDAGESDVTQITIGEELVIGLAKDASVVGNRVTIDYYLENFGNVAATVTLDDDLDDLFGAGNYSIFTGPAFIVDPGGLTLDAGFDGSAATSFFSSGDLGVGTVAQVQVVVDVTTVVNSGMGTGNYQTQSTLFATAAGGSMAFDVSDAGTDPDPNGNGRADDDSESDVTTFQITVPVVGVSENATVNRDVVTLDFVIENLGNAALSNLSLTEDLDSLFGAGNYALLSPPTLVGNPRDIVVNESYNGSTITQLVSSGTLATGASEQIRVMVRVDTLIDAGSGLGVYSDQVTVSAEAGGNNTSDLSDAGLNPDANSNSDPTDSGEDDATLFTIIQDFGDAPDTYLTSVAASGPIHFGGGPTLGATRDTENDAPTPLDGTGDDGDSTDDEDGVSFTSMIVAGQMATVDVTISQDVLLNAFVDFDGDGSFAQLGDQIFTDEPLTTGVNSLSFVVPGNARQGGSYARFRINTAGGLTATSAADDGEIEDYAITMEAAAEFSVATSSDDEDAGANIPLLLVTGTVTTPQTLTLGVTGGNTTAGTDFTNSGTISIPVGTYDGTIGTAIDLSSVLSVTSDDVVEMDEMIVLQLQSPSPGLVLGDADSDNSTQSTHTYTITNDDAATLQINDVTRDESDNGTTTFTFTVTLSAAVDVGVSVDFDTGDDTATAGSDYTANTGSTLTFAGTAGETETLTVVVAPDDLVERDETFFVDLSNIAAGGRAVSFADSRGIGTITNEDAATLSIDDVTVAEGDSGTTNFTFTVTLSEAVDTGVSVQFDTVDNTAVSIGAAADFASVAGGSLNFTGTANETQTLTITANTDDVVELDESFFVDLTNILASSRNVTFADDRGVGTITNEDAATLSIDDVTLGEGDSGSTAFTFTVTLNAAVDTGITLQADTVDSGAVSSGTNSDFVAVSGASLSFTGSASETQTVTVMVNVDESVELDESFFVDLSSIMAGGRNVTFADNRGLGSITNDDAATIRINDVLLDEGDSGNTTYTFSVTLDAAVDTGISLQADTVNSTASSSGATPDFTALTGEAVNFVGSVGETQTVTVSVITDEIVELDESFFVDLSNIVTGGRAVTFADDRGVGTIRNDDTATISINDVAIQEGDTGNASLVFTVTLDAAVDTGVAIQVDTADSGAVSTGANADFTSVVAGALNFTGMVGETQTLTVLASGDGVVELDESFFVDLSNITAGGRSVTFADNRGVGTITNDDAATLSIDDVTQDEGDGGSTLYTFTVTLDADVDTGIALQFDTIDNTAASIGARADFTSVIGGVLNFAGTRGETQTLSVSVTTDEVVELEESFFVDLSNIAASGRNVTFSDGRGTGTLSNDDAATISINDVVVDEGHTGSSTLTFTVTLDGEVDAEVTVDYETQDDSADSSTGDYAADTGSSLTFTGNSAPNSVRTFSITAAGDTTVELTESFFANLSNITAGGRDVTFADNRGVGTLRNDDAAEFTVSDTSGHEDSGSITVTVTLSNPVDVATSIDVSTADGTAVVGDGDYVSLNNVTLNFGAGDTTQTFEIAPTGDNVVELDETLTASLSNPSVAGRAVTVTSSSATITVTNDDAAEFTIIDTSGDEDGGPITVTVTLSNPVDVATSIDVSTADGTATVGDDDYAAFGNVTLNFAAGDTTQTFTVSPTADLQVESNEDVRIDLGSLAASARSVTASTTRGNVTIVNDDRLPLIVVGSDAPRRPTVRVVDPATGIETMRIDTLGSDFAGGVRTAVADVNNDGTEDIIIANGPGSGPRVQVYDGSTGEVLSDFSPFASGFFGGVYIAAGDVNNDGQVDIITAAGEGGGPHVRVFDGATGERIRNFFAFDDSLTGGVRIASGDVNGDGYSDIITATGPGSAANVRVYSGADNSVLHNFIAYPASFLGGANVAAGDLNGDGNADIITGAGAGGGPHVRAYDGVTGVRLASFFAFSSSSTAGARVTASDVTGDGLADILVSPERSSGHAPRGFDSANDFAATTHGLEIASLGHGFFANASTLREPTSNIAPEVNRGIGNQSATTASAFDFTVRDDAFLDRDRDDILTFSATLADGDALPAWLSFDAESLTFSGTPAAPGDVGRLTVRVTVNDGMSGVASDDFTLTVRDAAAPPPPPGRIAIGAGAGDAPWVQVIDASTGEELQRFLAFNSAFRGGVDVALADVNNDGTDDVVVGAGPSGGPHVKVFDGATGDVLQSFFPFDVNFTGGVHVASADVNGDGYADIITGAGPGGSPRVRVYSGQDLSLLHNFNAYSSGFGGGVDVAVGDVNGDGLADIITGAGPGGGPHVKVFDGANGDRLHSFFAFGPSFVAGVSVSAGDINGDGLADVIVGSNPGSIAEVRVFDARTSDQIRRVVPFGNSFTGGVSVASTNANRDSFDDVIVGRGNGSGPHIKTFVGEDLLELDSFFAFDEAFRGGVQLD